MKKNRIAIITVIVLSVLSFWFIINKSSGTIKQTLRDFAVTDTATITKIFLADKNGNSVTLERKPPVVQWIVNGKYKVRPDAMQTLLNTIKKIDVKEPVGKKAQDNVIKRLSSTAIKCEIYQNNKLTKAYYVGNETADQTGTYMILIDLENMKPSEKAFVTYIPGFEGYLTTRYFVEERGWRDRTVFEYVPDKIKSVKFEAPSNPENNYEVVVVGPNNFQVKKANSNQPIANLDTLAVKQYLSYFQQLNFEVFDDGLSQAQKDSTLSSKPINIVTVTDYKGQTNKVTFYTRGNFKQVLGDDGKVLPFDPVRMDAFIENTKDFVLLQYYVFGKVLPPIDYFQKKPQFTKTAPKKLP